MTKTASGAAASAPAAATAFPPPLRHEILQKRLLMGVGNKGGSRGSLTRCLQKWSQLRHRALAAANAAIATTTTTTTTAEPSADTPSAVETASRQDLERELQLYQVDMKKMVLQIKAHQRESNQLDQQLQSVEQRTLQERQCLVELRAQVKRAKRSRNCLEEYEALAKLANQRPPRRILEEGMKKVQQELAKVKGEEAKTTHELAIRDKQFHLLMQCMLDLKRSLTEPVDDVPVVEQGGESATTSNKNAATNGQGERGDDDDDDDEEGAVNEDAMETDEADPLYGDL